MFITLTVCLSIIGLVFIDVLLLQSDKHQIISLNRNLIGLSFSSLCILGILAALYPNKCQKTSIFMSKKSRVDRREYDTALKTQFNGHHPDCQSFSGNRIKVGSRIFCSACAGLIIGSIVALSGAVLYFFVGYNLVIDDFRILLVAEFGMVVGLFQYKFRNYAKLAVNAFFVISSFTVLVFADFSANNLLIDVYVFGIIIFVLISRIAFSQIINKKICDDCKKCFLI